MKFEYLKVYKNGNKNVGYLEASTPEAAKLMIKKLAPCTGTIRAVYDIYRVRDHVICDALHPDADLSNLKLIWEADNAK